jgi:hypothetical protein
MLAMAPEAHLPASVVAAWHSCAGFLKAGVQYSSAHTGVPAVVVAAAMLVLSWRLFKRALRFAVELAAAIALVLFATQMGWITF